MGKDFTVGHESAVEYLCSHYLHEKNVNDATYLYMPLAYEGHINAFLGEAVLDSGIELAYRFRMNNRDYTIADVVAGAKALFTFDPRVFHPDNLAWSLLVFAYTTNPELDHWINAHGESIRFSEVVEFGIDTLEKASRQFQASMVKGILSEKPDGIHNFTCGGTHLIYGLSTCLRFGHRRNALAERMKTQFDILVWRLESDSRFIERYYELIAAQYPREAARMYFLDAKLKFLGHAFEVLNLARLFGLFVPTPDQENIIDRALQELLDVVGALSSEEIRDNASDQTLFELLVGDSCHAYHGLTMTAEE